MERPQPRICNVIRQVSFLTVCARRGARLFDSECRAEIPGRRPFATVASGGMRASVSDAIGGVLASLIIFRVSCRSQAVQAGNLRLK
jgi:hypothetical protein